MAATAAAGGRLFTAPAGPSGSSPGLGFPPPQLPPQVEGVAETGGGVVLLVAAAAAADGAPGPAAVAADPACAPVGRSRPRRAVLPVQVNARRLRQRLALLGGEHTHSLPATLLLTHGSRREGAFCLVPRSCHSSGSALVAPAGDCGGCRTACRRS